MKKALAIKVLSGDPKSPGSLRKAADAVGISLQAVAQWPDPLPQRLQDRVLAALARRHLPEELRRLLAEDEVQQPAEVGHVGA